MCFTETIKKNTMQCKHLSNENVHIFYRYKNHKNTITSMVCIVLSNQSSLSVTCQALDSIEFCDFRHSLIFLMFVAFFKIMDELYTKWKSL